MTYNNWFFDKADFKRTPSILDGISYETEQRYRREGARFINKVGTKMNLRYDTMATGVVYFHRFYMCHSFKQFPRYITACCCLFLAGKVEETPKKCKDIIKNAKYFITDSQFAKFGEDPKEEVLTLERILLQTINFDLQVDHPYNYLLKYAKILKGDQEKLQKMVQMAWTFINDSMCTTISLQWEPEVIAIALMFLAGKLTKFDVLDWDGKTINQSKWWDMYVEDISTELLEDICHQVLDLYSMPMPESPKDSPIYESPKHNPTYNDAQLNPTNPTLINSAQQQQNINTGLLTGPIVPPNLNMNSGNLPIPTSNRTYPILPPTTNLPPPQINMPPSVLPQIPPNQFSNYKSHPPILPPTGPPIPINDFNLPQASNQFYPRPPYLAQPPTTGPPHHLPPMPTNNGHPFPNI